LLCNLGICPCRKMLHVYLKFVAGKSANIKKYFYEVIKVKCNLRKILNERGIKQSWLAEEVKIGSAHMSRIKNGLLPRLDLAYKIAAALGLTVYDVWEIEEAKKAPS
jgi:putative transcriptional regulator